MFRVLGIYKFDPHFLNYEFLLLFLHLGNTNYYTTNTNFASDDVYVMDASDYYYYRVQVSIESVDHGTSEWSDELIVLTREMEENFPWYSGTNQELEDLKVLIVR